MREILLKQPFKINVEEVLPLTYIFRDLIGGHRGLGGEGQARIIGLLMGETMVEMP